MRTSVLSLAFVAGLAGMTGLAAAYANKRSSPVAVQTAEPGKPDVKLAVLVVFDQLRGDYLEQWRGLLGPDGFARLQRDGAWFTNCYYPYATTTTGPGHSSMLSGTCPDRHGIINNAWYEDGVIVTCAGSAKYKLVPAPPTPAPDAKSSQSVKSKPKEIGAPERLLAETVGDVLRPAKPQPNRPESKVFGLSLKDRSAILPAGKHPSGAYWFVDGRFVTSSYYADGVHPWVAQFNELAAGGKLEGANRWFGKGWQPCRFDHQFDYFDWLDPVAAELAQWTPEKAANQPAFDHPNTGGKAKPGKEYYEHLATSSDGNKLLLELAKACVTAEQLGKRNAKDLLVVSFSSNDLVGHAYGPDSPEVLDVTLCSDAILAELLHFLDAQVGRDKYVLALTADHGVCPLPEASRKRGIADAARVDAKKLQDEVETFLTARFASSADSKEGKKPQWIEAFGNASTFSLPWMYVNPKVAAAHGKTREEVAQAAAEFLNSHSQVARAYTRTALAANQPENDVIAHRVQRSFHPQRSGDVYVLLKPYCIPGEGTFAKSGTTHGTPYNYDTHVPLMVYGPGIAGGVRTEPVTPQAAAAILSKWLEVRLPDKAEFPTPLSLVSQ
jgi:predicted AlkP superfamily pyrophosphatase or phosphodiesterase